MDKDRQIRFLYPPLIFLGSIALGIYLDNSITLKTLIDKFPDIDTSLNIVLAILGAGSLVLLLGYLLGTVTVFLLKVIFKLLGNGFNYEEWLSDKYYSKIGEIILIDKNQIIQKKDRLYAVSTFDHEFISTGVHLWLVRRWNAFFISISSTVAIISSLMIGILALRISFNICWLIVAIIFSLLLGWLGYHSWNQSMRMIEFQTRVRPPED